MRSCWGVPWADRRRGLHGGQVAATRWACHPRVTARRARWRSQCNVWPTASPDRQRHHVFRSAGAKSFWLAALRLSPAQRPGPGELAAADVVVFIIGLKAGAPVIGRCWWAPWLFGLVARTVPQMNVFVVPCRCKIAVGLLFCGLQPAAYAGGYLGRDLFGSAGSRPSRSSPGAVRD
ncbi:MAG: flagellar biosynthetic protein FliR [Deltaproteobacteria bacterium]|nr:flagellar biosynthetic protein FliR [Deltaproteobacteria bacterium]